MCRRHWYMLPTRMRSAVWNTYRPGQEDDKRPSRDYLDAAQAAITWLADFEREHGKFANASRHRNDGIPTLI
jgi:hypothetical protein